MTVHIRERPPLRLNWEAKTPSGYTYRWAHDEWNPLNAPSAETCSTAMPGGFDQASLTLARKPGIDYSDLERLSTLTARGAGGKVAWQGRLETAPRASGEQMSVSPGLVGWQSHLDDDNSAREIYVDIDYGNWAGASVQRQINLLNAAIDETDASTSADTTTGEPSLITQLTGTWSREAISEGWYDAHGLPIGALYYGWKLQSPGDIGDDTIADGWTWAATLSVDDVASAIDSSGNLLAAGPGSGVLTPTTLDRVFAQVAFSYPVGGGSSGTAYPVFWTCLAVFGTHGLTLYGTPSATSAQGVLSSDVEAHAVSRWAPKLSFTTGPNGSIQPSSFVIEMLSFTDPTTTSAIIKGAVQFELRDWAVWEGPTYYSNARGARGNRWRARVGPSGLQDTGPQISRLFNGVIVQYTDIAGISRTAGPPSSVADTTDPTLQDPDPLNPANQGGIRKWGLLQMGTSTSSGAVQTGQVFLQEQKLVDTSGQAAIVGYVLDASGVFHAAWEIRAGDQISFVDASDTSYRRVVSTSWDDSSKTNQITLDSPPDGMQALLERLSVTLTPLGFS